MERQAAFCQYSSSADAEMLAAIAAAVRHWLHVLNRRDRQTAAMRARDFTGPTVVLEILPRRFLVREALEELIKRNGFWFVSHKT